MKILNVVQGSPEWIAVRRTHRCASDAPVMMGVSQHTKRSELVRMKATGDEKEFSEWEQKNLLAKGHEAEASARTFVEEMLGEDLFPVTGTDDAGLHLASFDGITMDGKTGFEHKLWNKELAEAVKAGELPPMYYWQLEQQILVGGLERVIFVCSNGLPEKRLHMEYRAVPGRAEQLLAGWKQFDEDVAGYQHVEFIPAPRGREIKDLPVISVQLVGKVKSSNLTEYRTNALRFIEGINTDLKTDQDFADAEKTVKFCEETESKIDEAKKRALAETASIADLFATLDELKAAMRGKRLDLNRLVEERKKAIRADILREGQTVFAAHIAGLNTRLGRSLMPMVPADFAGAMKGKKSISSLRDAVATTLAHAKIAANAIADQIGINLNTLRDAGAENQFLFPDVAQIVLKQNDDFAGLVKLRVAEHKERERKRQEDAARVAPPAAVAPAAQSATPTSAKVVPLREPRPSDDKIIAALCNHFNVSPDTVIAWLRDMDLAGATSAELSQSRG